jgi:hypothetical protein
MFNARFNVVLNLRKRCSVDATTGKHESSILRYVSRQNIFQETHLSLDSRRSRDIAGPRFYLNKSKRTKLKIKHSNTIEFQCLCSNLGPLPTPLGSSVFPLVLLLRFLLPLYDCIPKQ